MPTTAAMIMTTVKDKNDAAAMAGHLIQEHLAACVQEISIHSHFNWDGKTNSEPEVLLLIKTAQDRVESAIEAIKKNHSYDVPEILVVPVVNGLAAYLGWINDETRPSTE